MFILFIYFIPGTGTGTWALPLFHSTLKKPVAPKETCDTYPLLFGPTIALKAKIARFTCVQSRKKAMLEEGSRYANACCSVKRNHKNGVQNGRSGVPGPKKKKLAHFDVFSPTHSKTMNFRVQIALWFEIWHTRLFGCKSPCGPWTFENIGCPKNRDFRNKKSGCVHDRIAERLSFINVRAKEDPVPAWVKIIIKFLRSAQRPYYVIAHWLFEWGACPFPTAVEPCTDSLQSLRECHQTYVFGEQRISQICNSLVPGFYWIIMVFFFLK